MKTLWLAACVAVVALAATGCRRESGDGQAKAFDANVDPVAVAQTGEPSQDILADQTLISRKVKESRSAAPAGAASTGPAPAAGTATSAPAGDANKPPAAGGAEASPATGDANAAPAAGAGAAPAAADGSALEPQTLDGVRQTLKIVQAAAKSPLDAPFDDFLAEPDAAAAKPIADSARKCQEKIKSLDALGKEKAKADVLGSVNKTLALHPQPWLPGLAWGQVPESGLKFAKAEDKVVVAIPDSRIVFLIKVGDKWKVEYTAQQRDSVKLLAEYFDAEAKYLDAVIGDVNSGALTAANCQDKVAEHYGALLVPTLTKASADQELRPAIQAPPPGRAPGGPGPARGPRGPGPVRGPTPT